MPLFYILLFFLLQFHSTYHILVCHSCNSIYIYIYVYIHKTKKSYTYKFVSSCSQCFTRIMEAPLTENVISSLLSGAVHLQPLLQVFRSNHSDQQMQLLHVSELLSQMVATCTRLCSQLPSTPSYQMENSKKALSSSSPSAPAPSSIITRTFLATVLSPLLGSFASTFFTYHQHHQFYNTFTNSCLFLLQDYYNTRS